MRSTFLVLVLLALLSLSVVSAVDVPGWTSCATGDDVNVTSIVSNEWPPQKGDDLKLNITGYNSKNITSGTYVINIHVDGLPLPSIDGNIDDFRPLPWPVGNLTAAFSQTIPSAAPSGTYTIKISAVDQDKKGVFCISLSVKISKAEAEDRPSLLASLVKGSDRLKRSVFGAKQSLAKPAKVPSMPRMKRA